MGILELAQRPFTLTLLREVGPQQKKSTVKSLFGVGQNQKRNKKNTGNSSTSGRALEEELNVVLGRDEWAPLGMTFQTCTDGAHKIIFVDPEGQGGYAGIQVGDFIVGVNYKPLSFGYTHDEVVKLIRSTPKPFTLNTIRKKPDEVSGLVGQVKTSLAAAETIAAKDEEIARLQDELAAALARTGSNGGRGSDGSSSSTSDSNSRRQQGLERELADVRAGLRRREEEVVNLKSQVAELKKELTVARIHEQGIKQVT
jgi:hypothetical protein